MAKKITKDEIFEKGLLSDVIKDANEAIQVFDKLDTELLKVSKSYKAIIDNSSKNSKGSITELINASKQLNQITEQTVLIEKEKLKVDKQVEKARVDEIRLQQAREKNIDNYNKQLEKQQQLEARQAKLMADAERPYNKMSGTLNQLIKDYRDLVLVGQENTNVALNMKKQIDSLDATLKKVDATTGRHQRNVGNYSSAYNGLGNSINQLTREMPAFANSMQTGFMAISNNLPIFFDEIQRIKQANIELQASGEPTKSVMKQIGSSIFSVGTALSVGVTLLTVFGGKLIEWIFTNTEATKALEKQRAEQKRVNEEIKKATEFVGNESASLVGLLIQLKSTNEGSKERIKLIQQINDDYGLTLKNLSSEAKFQSILNQEILKYINYQRNRYQLDKLNRLEQMAIAKMDRISIELKQKHAMTQKQLDVIIENSVALQGSYTGSLDASDQKILELIETYNRLLGYGGRVAELTGQMTEDYTANAKATEKAKKELEDYTIQVKELQNARIEDAKQRRTAELELKYTTDLSAIKSDGIKANELRIELEKQYLSDLRDLQVEFDKIRNEENDKKIKFINDQHLLDIENQIQAKEIEMQTELNSADSEKEKIQIRKIYGDELRELKIKQLEEQKRIELQNYELTEKEKLAIQQKYDLEILKLKEGTIQAEDDLDKKALEKEKKRLEEMRNFRRQIFNELLDELKRQSEARESQYDKDIQTQKDFQSQLQAQANAGNITAQQSIAQSIEAEKKATIEKAKEQKKQQQIEDIKTLYNLINQNIDKGDNAGVATAKATASMTLIKGIAKLFQGFAKGTKWKLGDEDKPFMSGVDGHIVRVDSSEAIINGGLMNKAEKAGIKSTEQLVNSAVMYQNYNPQMMRINDDRLAFNSGNAMMSIEPITQRLESLEQTIKNKVEFRIDPYIVNGIVKGVMETEKSKNLTRKNIYKS